MGPDTVEFILCSEREFEIAIRNRDAENILTVCQFSTYVHQKLLYMHAWIENNFRGRNFSAH